MIPAIELFRQTLGVKPERWYVGATVLKIGGGA